MCEALMKQNLQEIQANGFDVASAGLNANPGHPIHPLAALAAEEFGLSLHGHKARLLTAGMVADADAIFIMDYQNLAQLLARFPEAVQKSFFLGAYANRQVRSMQIRDPYYRRNGEIRPCYETINGCIRNLVETVCAS